MLTIRRTLCISQSLIKCHNKTKQKEFSFRKWKSFWREKKVKGENVNKRNISLWVSTFTNWFSTKTRTAPEAPKLFKLDRFLFQEKFIFHFTERDRRRMRGGLEMTSTFLESKLSFELLSFNVFRRKLFKLVWYKKIFDNCTWLMIDAWLFKKESEMSFKM